MIKLTAGFNWEVMSMTGLCYLLVYIKKIKHPIHLQWLLYKLLPGGHETLEIPWHTITWMGRMEKCEETETEMPQRQIWYNFCQACFLPSLRTFFSANKLLMKLIVSGCWQNPFAERSNKKTWSRTASCIRATCWAEIQPNVGCHSMSTPTIPPS